MAPLIRTAEIRWFLDGDVSAEALAWFAERFGATPEESRTDRYLVLPSQGAVGIKLRAHVGLEVKVRTGNPEAIDLPAGPSGYAEQWAKWTCHDPAVTAAVTTVAAGDARWLEVHKRRRLCRLAIDGDHARPLEWGAATGGGGHVELTHVATESHQAGTLGLEAWGTPETVKALLDVMVRTVLAEEPGFPTALPREASLSYPGWLEAITRDAR